MKSHLNLLHNCWIHILFHLIQTHAIRSCVGYILSIIVSMKALISPPSDIKRHLKSITNIMWSMTHMNIHFGQKTNSRSYFSLLYLFLLLQPYHGIQEMNNLHIFPTPSQYPSFFENTNTNTNTVFISLQFYMYQIEL